MNMIEQLIAGIMVMLGVAYAILQFFHSLSFPISESKMRRIVREEVKKLIVVDEQ